MEQHNKWEYYQIEPKLLVCYSSVQLQSDTVRFCCICQASTLGATYVRFPKPAKRPNIVCPHCALQQLDPGHGEALFTGCIPVYHTDVDHNHFPLFRPSPVVRQNDTSSLTRCVTAFCNDSARVPIVLNTTVLI